MFSGIIETSAPILTVEERPHMLSIQVARPAQFSDIATGDSICVDGVCLTVEKFTTDTMIFCLAAETVAVTGWTKQALAERAVNLERSLKLGDRIHGHFVTGHVDGVAEVRATEALGAALQLTLRLPEALARFVWKKGSMAVNGVSLTVNEVRGCDVDVCLIPETLARTNLSRLDTGSRVNIETDTMAKALLRSLEFQHQPQA